MKNPKKPTRDQKELISKAGLNPEEWMVTMEDKQYLHLVERHYEHRTIRIIDKETHQVMGEKRRKSEEKHGNYTGSGLRGAGGKKCQIECFGTHPEVGCGLYKEGTD